MYNLARIMYKTVANITEVFRVLRPFLSDLTAFSRGIYKCIGKPLQAIYGLFTGKSLFWHGKETAQIIHYQNGHKTPKNDKSMYKTGRK